MEPERAQTDSSYVEAESVVRRYTRGALDLPDSLVRAVSSREGAAIIGEHLVNDVRLLFLDLSSLSTTGTFKDWVACLTIATCLRDRRRSFITQSSGNTGNALAYYAARADIDVCILYPQESRYKINSDLALHPGIEFVEVAGGEPIVKLCAEVLEDVTGLPWLPRLDLQKAGNGLRADFVGDFMKSRGECIDWHVQALSSAFGPLGFYDRLSALRSRGKWGVAVPRFLGVQQEAVTPYYDRIYRSAPGRKSEPRMIEPTLFRSNPSERLVSEMKDICRRTRGRIVVLGNQAYAERKDQAIELLRALDLNPTPRIHADGQLGLLEEAGLMALAAALIEIETGSIAAGETVLVTLTGGFMPRTDPPFEPQLRLGPRAWRAELAELGRRLRS